MCTCGVVGVVWWEMVCTCGVVGDGVHAHVVWWEMVCMHMWCGGSGVVGDGVHMWEWCVGDGVHMWCGGRWCACTCGLVGVVWWEMVCTCGVVGDGVHMWCGGMDTEGERKAQPLGAGKDL